MNAAATPSGNRPQVCARSPWAPAARSFLSITITSRSWDASQRLAETLIGDPISVRAVAFGGTPITASVTSRVAIAIRIKTPVRGSPIVIQLVPHLDVAERTSRAEETAAHL
jgi:hypothetical protein